jgi:phosphoglycerate dehydrogenase-like enzyme
LRFPTAVEKSSRVTTEARVWLGPEQPDALVAAIEGAGGTLVAADRANAVVWSTYEDEPETISDVLHDGVKWVQLDSAGVDVWLDAGLIDKARVWTAAKGVYGPRVAEHAMALLLAAARGIPQAARAKEWGAVPGEGLLGKTVGILGAGGIGQEVIVRLRGFGVRILALTRSGGATPGADASYGPEQLDRLLADSDFVVLAMPLTPKTEGIIGARELELLGPHGWLVNVGRGQLVDTSALVAAIERGQIAGACLDVVVPEPLPPSHPLWSFPNVLITPHVAHPWEQHYEPYARRVAENVARFLNDAELLGVVDPEKSY